MRKVTMLVTLVAVFFALSGIASASSSTNANNPGRGGAKGGTVGLHSVGAASFSPATTTYAYVDFPGTGDFFCGSNYCGTLGYTYPYSQTDYMWNTGNFVQTPWLTTSSLGITSVTDLTAAWTFQDLLDYGQYEQWNVYVNDTWVAYTILLGCGECFNYYTVSGTVNFADVPPMDGGYVLTLMQVSPTIGQGLGSIAWGNADYWGGGTVVSGTPEPGSLMLLGAGLLGLGAAVRRRLGR